MAGGSPHFQLSWLSYSYKLIKMLSICVSVCVSGC